VYAICVKVLNEVLGRLKVEDGLNLNFGFRGWLKKKTHKLLDC